MIRNTTPHFRKTLLALAASAALAPHGAWALDLATAPPGTKEPYVTPNVIISVDDSGSMNFRLDRESATGATNNVTPTNGSWLSTDRRMNVLKYALIGNNGTGGVFRDTTLLPEGKIRLAWQVLHNNGNAPSAKSVDSSNMNTNSMRPLDTTHRSNFISFVNSLSPNGGTPSHLMFQQADGYMRRPLGTNSLWASKPGTTGAPYLGCRRTYHIMMTDGRWNGSVSGGSQDDNTKNITLPDGTVYGSTTSASRPNTALYSDKFSDTLADWAFRSWAVPPAYASSMTGTMQPTADYRKAPATENFGKDSANKDAVLERYWNPRYNPATWPHMVTYTIGFSQMATTWPGAPSIVAPTNMVPFGYDGSFPDFVTGSKAWPLMDAENKTLP